MLIAEKILLFLQYAVKNYLGTTTTGQQRPQLCVPEGSGSEYCILHIGIVPF